MKNLKEKLLPLSLSAFIIFADQLVKAIIVKNWPAYGLIKDVFNNGFLWIYHIRNKVIAFSLGQNVPEKIRPVLFIILPVLVLGFLIWFYFTTNDFTKTQRWAYAGIIGGGLGNIIDRVFRPEGVVDFISVKFYGFLGFDRWPTFNIADSCVVLGCLLLFISVIFTRTKKKETSSDE